MPGETKQLDPIKKGGLVCVPNADVHIMKDREGNEMTTVVNTTPGSNQATNFVAPTRDGGYIGSSPTGASLERMIERVKSETGCEVHFNIQFNNDEELSKFETPSRNACYPTMTSLRLSLLSPRQTPTTSSVL